MVAAYVLYIVHTIAITRGRPLYRPMPAAWLPASTRAGLPGSTRDEASVVPKKKPI